MILNKKTFITQNKTINKIKKNSLIWNKTDNKFNNYKFYDIYFIIHFNRIVLFI